MWAECDLMSPFRFWVLFRVERGGVQVRKGVKMGRTCWKLEKGGERQALLGRFVAKV